MAGWTAEAGAASASGEGLLAGVVGAAIAAALGVLGTLRPAEWADGGALLVVGSAFLALGVSSPALGLGSLYLFVVLSLVTGHLLAFRRTVRPLLDPGVPAQEEALRHVFVNLMGRLALLGSLTFLLSVAVLAVAPALALPLASDVALFLLALGVLLGLLAMALLREEPITLK